MLTLMLSLEPSHLFYATVASVLACKRGLARLKQPCGWLGSHALTVENEDIVALASGKLIEGWGWRRDLFST